jgi:regulator of protease activity HflC (stomatin/prohibitin superfamily)
MLWIIYLAIFVIVLLALGLKVVAQYERGVLFTLGRYAGLMDPGLKFVVPIFQSWQRIDVRVIAVDVPNQDCITKDNISVKADAVLYYKVSNSKAAIIEVQDYHFAVSQLSQTTMRDVIGEVTLNDLLSERDAVSKKIRTIVDKATDPWGIKVESVDLKHIELPQEMVRVMAKAAEADREKKAVIIRAEGELEAAKNMAHAAHIMAKEQGALHLRTLQTLTELSSDKSNTVVFAVPLEVLQGFGALIKK